MSTVDKTAGPDQNMTGSYSGGPAPMYRSPAPGAGASSRKLSLLLDALQEVDGVLACGAFLGNHRVVYQTRHDFRFQRDRAKLVFKSLKETFRHLRAHKLKAERLQWSFPAFNVHGVHVKSMTLGFIVEKSFGTSGYDTVDTALHSFFSEETPGPALHTRYRHPTDGRTITIKPEPDSRTLEIEPLPDVLPSAPRVRRSPESPLSAPSGEGGLDALARRGRRPAV